MEENKMENYVSDSPISENKDDKFQRYNFAKRIAETIVQRNDPKSLVIGIYGSWGEGKTSVINFIEEELRVSTGVVICKFNPWRYKEEGQLLAAFFSLLAKQLDRSILTKKEKIAEKICNYGEAFSIDISGVKSGDLFKFYKEKNSVDIDEQKKRIENILEKEKKKIVIFIDDIDRLEKSEIQSIFKLIKLTGDFQYTNYVLAFDHIMVAKAIGENYEDGSSVAGKNFLEKIIQVPLQLPLAQKSALRDYCFERVNRAIDSNSITVPEGEARKFVKEFNENILGRLTTPRMAVRYSNAVSFALPILKGEVNLGDLMLIEAVKVFYPEVYDFIRVNSKYFIRSYESQQISSSNNDNEERKKSAKAEFEMLTDAFSSEDKVAIKNLLTDLFPLFGQVFQGIGYGEGSFQKWHDEKRIGSPQYFDRYFAYTVIKGELSDIEYDTFINAVGINDEAQINNYFSKVDTGKLAMKMLLFKADGYSSDLSKKLIPIFAKYGDKFSYNRNALTGIDTPVGQLAYLIYKLIGNIPNQNEKYVFSKQFISESTSFNLANYFFAYFKRKIDKEGEDQLLSEEQVNDLAQGLLQKAITEANGLPLFDKYPNDASYLLSKIWSPLLGKDDVMNYLKPILSAQPVKLIALLKAYSPFIRSSNYPKPYFGELEGRSYELISDTLDCEFLYDIALKLLPATNPYDYMKNEGEPSDENRIKQFVNMYVNATNYSAQGTTS